MTRIVHTALFARRPLAALGLLVLSRL